MLEFAARVGAVLAIFIGSMGLDEALGTPGNLLCRIFTFGAAAFFFSVYLEGSGFWARFHYIDSPTPSCVWKFLGILLWGIGTVILVYMVLHRVAVVR